MADTTQLLSHEGQESSSSKNQRVGGGGEENTVLDQVGVSAWGDGLCRWGWGWLRLERLKWQVLCHVNFPV